MRFRFKPNPDFSELRKALLREGVPDGVPLYELFADWEIVVAVTNETDNIVDPRYQKEVEAIEDRAIRFYYMLGYDYVPAGPGINRIAVLGGVDVGFLCRTTPEEVRRYVRNILETCAPDGGYCLGTGNSVANYIKVENYLTMLDEGLRWG